MIPEIFPGYKLEDLKHLPIDEFNLLTAAALQRAIERARSKIGE